MSAQCRIAMEPLRLGVVSGFQIFRRAWPEPGFTRRPTASAFSPQPKCTMLTILTLERVTSATGVDLETWAKDVVSLDKKAKDAKTELTGSMFDAGLVVYGVKCHHATLQAQRHVGSTTPWAATWKRLTGTDKPLPRATTMAIAIEAFTVEGHHLTEHELRACPVDSAETAVGIYRDVGSQLAHAAVVEAATLMKGYSGPKTDKERKAIITALKQLRRSLKPTEPMDADEAREKIQEVLKANPAFVRIVAVELVASLPYLPKEGREEHLHEVWSQFRIAEDNFPADAVDRWIGAITPAESPATPPPSEPTPKPAPVHDIDGWLAANVPAAINPDGRAKLGRHAAQFAAANSRLPASLAELAHFKKHAAASVPA